MELFERDQALRTLGNCLHDATKGLGRIALVYGEAGIGKTALVEGFLAAHGGEARMQLGRCDALFTPQPLGPLHDIAHQTGGALLDLIESASDRLAIFGALLRELQDSRTPTVLVFEDVHWADAATLDLLKYLGRRIRATTTLIVLTYRDEARRQPSSVVGTRHCLRCHPAGAGRASDRGGCVPCRECRSLRAHSCPDRRKPLLCHRTARKP